MKTLSKTVKSNFYLSAITKNNPKKISKVIRSISATDNHSQLPLCIVSYANTVTDTCCFNKHFFASGSLFSRCSYPVAVSALNSVPSAPDVGNMSQTICLLVTLPLVLGCFQWKWSVELFFPWTQIDLQAQII